MGKKVVIGSEARTKIKEGVDILANAVKATLGPRGRNAAIEREYGPPLITKDGVTVARHINLDDRLQNMGAQLVKSVASAANQSAGDGTTTATILAQEIFGAGVKMVASGYNPVLLKRGIDIAVTKIVAKLATMSMDVSSEENLKKVATISANNDPVLGGIIAEAIAAVGNDGVVSVEEAPGSETRVEYTDGLKLTRGVMDEAFLTNVTKMTCEFENPYILLYDEKITAIQEIVELLDEVISVGSPILIVVKDIDPIALAHIVYNTMKKAINSCVVKAPGFGDHRRGLFEDLALITGGKLFTNSDGRRLQDAKLENLGRARKTTAGLNATTILDGAGDSDAIDNEVAGLKNLLKDSTIFPHQKEVIQARISRLTGGAAIFKVGATSESEMREKRDRVEDAINAVRSALSEGAVSGGGSALLRCSPCLDEIDISKLLNEEIVGIDIIRKAIKAPFIQILINAGEREATYKYIDQIINSTTLCGFDAYRMEFVENMLDRGIIDPTKVVRTSLQQAASAAGTLLTTEVAIFESDFQHGD